MAIDLDEQDGQTPLDPDAKAGLIPEHLATLGDLNDWEQENILCDVRWLKRARVPEVLSEEFCRELHKQMFGKTWKWAGNIDHLLARFVAESDRAVRFNLKAKTWYLQFAGSCDAFWCGNFRDLLASVTRMAWTSLTGCNWRPSCAVAANHHRGRRRDADCSAARARSVPS